MATFCQVIAALFLAQLCSGLTGKLDMAWKDRAFLVPVKLGTPPSKHHLELWIHTPTAYFYGTACRNCRYPGHKFNESASSTFKEENRNFNVSDYTGRLRGHVGSDLLVLGNLDLNRQEVGVIHDEEPHFAVSPADGVLGLGKPRPGQDINTTGIFALLDQKKFTIFVRPGRNPKNDTGAITLGAHDVENCNGVISNFKFNEEFNAFSSSGVEVGKKTWGKRQFKTTLSTSDEYWTLPGEMAVALEAAFNVGKDGSVKCNARYPIVTLVVEGTRFEIPGRHLISNIEGTCYLNIVNAGKYTDIIIGKQFFYSYCVTHDYDGGRIGISESKKST